MTPFGTQMRTAAADVISGVGNWRLWLSLAWFDIRLRYRRTLLGPFWLALSSVVTIAILGFVYSRLFGMTLQEYLPYLASGLALWSLISSFLNEAPGVFIASASLAQHSPIPFSVHVCRRVATSALIFLHVLTSFIAVALVFGVPLTWNILLAGPAAVMLLAFGFWVTLLIGTVCLRYRDVGPAVGLGCQILIFVTPVFFRGDQLRAAPWVAEFNPCHHLLQIARSPLLGLPVPGHSWLVVGLLNILGCTLAIVVFARCRHRLSYWF